MGQNLARNLARHGAQVALYNRTARRTDEFMAEFGGEARFQPAHEIADFVRAIEPPRPILIMVKAGPAVDEAVAQLSPYLEPGDILIDGGNSLFTDTRRRSAEQEARGIRYIGSGISGGEEGALNGPSLMPGGSRDAYAVVQPRFEAIAAQVDGVPCCTFIGPDGAGHFVKMVHNGIEYADIQLIAEAYALLRWLGVEAGEQAEIFREWNQGDLDSYLIQITAEVLAKRDDSTGKPLVDVILDEAEQKGTGKWASQLALDLAVPATGITEAVFARMLSAQKQRRVAASAVLPGPSEVPRRDRERFVDDLRHALYASKLVAYAQGFELMAAGSAEYGWGLDLGALATIWRGGCIIRARFLDRIRQVYEAHAELPSLLLADYFRERIEESQEAWRRVVAAAVAAGVAVPAFSTSLAYYDGYRSERSPANLIQGLRDYFGAHTYRRVDREGSFHTRWAQEGREVAAG